MIAFMPARGKCFWSAAGCYGLLWRGGPQRIRPPGKGRSDQRTFLKFRASSMAPDARLESLVSFNALAEKQNKYRSCPGVAPGGRNGNSPTSCDHSG
jgi:hypothetical protein